MGSIRLGKDERHKRSDIFVGYYYIMFLGYYVMRMNYDIKKCITETSTK